MNPAHLLAHFDRIGEAPDAIPRLRRFILDLAVRGKLVEQDPRDEPAGAQLTRNDQARRETSKKDRRADIGPQILLADEEKWDVPVSWEWRGLADLVLFIDYRGKTPSKIEQGVRLITAKNVKQGFINLSPEEFLSDSNYHTWMTRGFPKVGDVLFTTEAPMGNCAVVRLPERFALAQRVICFRSYGAMDSDFLVLQLISKPFQFILDKTATGLTAKGIKAAKLKRLPVAVPPLAEQHRIVAKVDELMALCDRLETAQKERESRRDRLVASSLHHLNNGADADAFREHARFYFNHLLRLTTRPDHIKQLRQTILNLAVRGKLVPQNPTDEPADEMLARTMRHRQQKAREEGGKAPQPLLPISPDEVPYELPPGWVWERLGNIGDTNIGLTYSPQDLSQTGVPVLRSSNIQNGKIDLSDLVRVAVEPKRSVLVELGDLLICARNGSRALVGKAALIEHIAEKTAFGAFMAIFRSDLNQYLFQFICSPLFRQVISEVNTTTINQITQSNLRSTVAPIPPLAEQHRIVAKVDELLALCDQLETQLATTQSESQKLLETILHNALNSGIPQQCSN